MMNLPNVATGLVATLLAVLAGTGTAAEERPRNVVLLYADDLGYRRCRLLRGDRRQDAEHRPAGRARACGSPTRHSPAATCTPSRYALLTGQYAWRKSGHRGSCRATRP